MRYAKRSFRRKVCHFRAFSPLTFGLAANPYNIFSYTLHITPWNPRCFFIKKAFAAENQSFDATALAIDDDIFGIAELSTGAGYNHLFFGEAFQR